MDEHYDVIIIGTGAGGGTWPTAWRRRASASCSWAGPWLPREKQNWDVKAVFVENRYVSKDTWYDSKGTAFEPGSHYFVGGAPRCTASAVPAPREGLRRAAPPRRRLARLADLLQRPGAVLHRGRETLSRPRPPRRRSHRPAGEPPYPYPPLVHEPRIQELVDKMEKAGYPPAPRAHGHSGRRGTPSRPLHPLRHLRRLPVPGPRQGRCRNHLRAARADPSQRHHADQRARKQLKTSASVRSQRSGGGAQRSHRKRTRRALWWSPRATNSARLLLMSANDRHPRGLANGSDQVGRNYMFHNSCPVVAISKRENPTLFQKTLSLNDFYFAADGFRVSPGQYPDDRQVAGADVPRREAAGPFVPGFTLELMARHAIDFWLTTEDLPNPNNRVTLGDGGVRLNYTFNNQEPTKRLPARSTDARPRRCTATWPPVREHEKTSRSPVRPPGRHLPFRQRSGYLGARY